MSNLSFTYRGLIAPVFTPFNNNGTLNLDLIPSYAEYLARNGVNGVLVNGTTGEGTSMNVLERKAIAEAWSEAVKSTKQHLMIQVGGAPLPDVIELAKHAESIKVNSLLCLPELYFKPNTPQELKEYLKRVGKAAPNTPLLYYHIPMFTNVNIHMGQFLDSIGNEIPSFVGIKFTSNDLVEGSQALRADNRKYVIFLGSDQIISAACSLGMDSFIATSVNMFPQFAKDILTASDSGKMLAAREKQEKLTEAVIAISKYGNWVQTMKHAMRLVTGINMGPPRSPLKHLSDEFSTSMEEDLKKLKYIN
ncbi:hypothetical protein KPH14_010023 [Odynerus spinipes]|uniref:N-acetylneuraminate lyase n=1 Tax=Odynerus spinipes TaxID=1348599 RepID=A0AAD9RTC0_9HYME|nr:hypothetical protein KPH14_010023 [Odynerus spinipes]